MKTRDRWNARAFEAKQRLLRRHAWNQFEAAVSVERQSTGVLRSINWQKRVRLLKHAYSTVPYYRRMLASSGIHPNDIRHPDDWDQIPILTRSDIKENEKDLRSTRAQARDFLPVTTGGSTGVPIRVFHDGRFPQEILGWRMLRWWGLRAGTDVGYVWRLTRRSGVSRLRNQLMWWPTRRIWLDASTMARGDIARFLSEMNQRSPALLQGYAGAVHHLALAVLDSKAYVHSPDAVWVTASPISLLQRSTIEGAFGAPVYDQYGCSEVFWIAAECEKGGLLHVFADARHLEFIDDSGLRVAAGESGRLVVTDLENYAFPILRYANNDVGRESSRSCECGRNLPLMEPVRGRTSDMVQLPDKSVIAGEYLTTIFDDFPEAASSFQVVQRADYSLSVRVVPAGDAARSEAAFDAVRRSLLQKVNGQVRVEVEPVDEIANRGGKTRFVVSEIEQI